MRFIDFHCDTLWMAYLKKRRDVVDFPEAMTDLRRLKETGSMAQFFAICMLPPAGEQLEIPGLEQPVEDADYFADNLKIFRAALERCAFAAAACNAEQMERNDRLGKVSCFLTLEDGRSADGKLENIKRLYDCGIRLISLTWNYENCWGAPKSFDPQIMRKGLTDFGKDGIAYMNELGIIIDVSHLSDGGFWDVVRLSKKPFVASHSDCRALSPHPRNLTDEMLTALGDTGGVAGINFMPGSLNEDISCTKSTAALLAAHIQHMIRVGGLDCVALGSDWDGIEGDIEVNEPCKLELLFHELHKRGLSEDQIEQIAWKNAKRVIAESMR